MAKKIEYDMETSVMQGFRGELLSLTHTHIYAYIYIYTYICITPKPYIS